MEEQKICLKFIDPIELHLNLATHKSATLLNTQLISQVQKTFTNMLVWVTASESDLMKSKYEKEIKAAFQLDALEIDFVLLCFYVFRTLLRDRIYGYFYDLYGFVNAVPPAQTIDHLILIIKNDLEKYDLRLV